MSALDSFRLDGRTVVVTGASGGLGAEAAVAIAEAGATVVITGRRERELLQVAERVRMTGATCDPQIVDITDEAGVEAAFVRAVGEVGPLHGIVNNAAQAFQSDISDVTLGDWDRIVDVNLRGTFIGVQTFLRHRAREDPTSIVNVSSIAAFAGVRGQSAYSASKAGVVGLTRALAVELARDGVRVNAIAPGYFATDMPRQVLADQDAAAALLRKIPQRRVAAAAEIGPPVVFLLSDASSYMTGAVLNFDGGYTAV